MPREADEPMDETDVSAGNRAMTFELRRAPIVEIAGVTKRFGGVHALRGVDLRICAGEVHALLGEHGPAAALRSGIAVVFQEFSLMPALSVAENIYLGTGRAAHGSTAPPCRA